MSANTQAPVNAMTLMLALWERGMDMTLDPANGGKVTVTPARLLTDADRAAIRHHLPAIKRLLSVDYSNRPDGWQQDEGMPERVILVNKGALTDSCLFRTETGAKAFLSLLHTYTTPQAFRAACAIEDGEHDPVKLQALARAASH
ncbi:MAG: hypothetical protein AB1717_05970 [Pseudomonadota bacterium]